MYIYFPEGMFMYFFTTKKIRIIELPSAKRAVELRLPGLSDMWGISFKAPLEVSCIDTKRFKRRITHFFETRLVWEKCRATMAEFELLQLFLAPVLFQNTWERMMEGHVCLMFPSTFLHGFDFHVRNNDWKHVMANEFSLVTSWQICEPYTRRVITSNIAASPWFRHGFQQCPGTIPGTMVPDFLCHNKVLHLPWHQTLLLLSSKHGRCSRCNRCKWQRTTKPQGDSRTLHRMFFGLHLCETPRGHWWTKEQF